MAQPRPRLSVSITGRGHPLALFHGGVGSRSHWIRNIPTLARRFEVQAFDLPGYGASPDVPEEITPDDYIGWCAEEIDRLAAERGPVRLAAFSFGGCIAAGVAARLKGTIERLALIGPGGFGPATGRVLDLRNVPKSADRAARREVLRHNLRQMMLVDDRSIDEATLDLHEANIINARFVSLRISQLDRIASDLAAYRGPLLLVYGECDGAAYPSVADRIARVQAVRPDAQVTIIPEAGHWAAYERPREVNDVLLAFFSRY